MRITAKKFRNIGYSIRRLIERDEFINKRPGGKLTFGICLFNRFTVSDRSLQVMGDELQARAIAREVISHCPEVKRCRIYDIKEADGIKDDIVFVMWADYPLLKKRPSKYVLWLQNAGFENKIGGFLKTYDHVLTPSKKLCAKYPEIVYMPMACEDPDIFRKVSPDGRYGSDICFVGNFNGAQRPTRLQEEFMLPAAKYDFALWGTNWERSEIKEIKEAARGRLEPKDVPAAYSSAKIVLANHWLAHREEEMITTRIYEALACEAFVISDHFAALDEFKEHVVFTEGGQDLAGKLDYYLSYPEKRAEKVRGARDFILRNHTFKNRVETMAKTTGLKFN